MGFLDNIKDRLMGSADDNYYDDYDDYYYDDLDDPSGEGSGVLGNTRRPEPDSVSVYTRSGRPLETTSSYDQTQRRSYTSGRTGYGDDEYKGYAAPEGVRSTTSTPAPTAALPPYVLRPEAYDDVQTVVRRVRTKQPVILVLKQTDMEVAKRILDFSFGLSFGIDGSVEEIGEGTFAVLPNGRSLSPADLDKLVADGVITR